MTNMIRRVARAIDDAPVCFTRRNKMKEDGETYEVCLSDEAGDPVVFARVSTQHRASQIEQDYNRRGRALAAIAAIRKVDRDETLASYSRTDGRREWVNVGAWLYPGEAIVKIDDALAEKDAKA